ncbi:MAG: hypothetical protein IKA50_02920 [Clostridia bacterium]|nr:hypothetical protein [Clostridia bacterium]
MKRVLALLLCLVMAFSVTACGKKEAKKATPTTTAAATTTKAKTKTYAHNEVINRFFVQFEERHNGKYLDTASIRRGRDVSEYIATINECQVTIMDVSKKQYASGERYALQFEIVGGTSNKQVDRMLEAFAAVALAMDSDCTVDATDNATAMLKKMTKPFGTRTRISDRVYIAHYTPVVTDPVLQPCRISLLTKDDIVTQAATATTTTAKK